MTTSKHPIHAIFFLLFNINLCFFIHGCKKPDESKFSTQSRKSIVTKSSLQLKAEKIIADDPNVELVEAFADSLHIKNIYSGRSLTIPFQYVIDGYYEMIREDKELADQMKANRKKPTSYTLTTQPGWGHSPAWIPRYPGLIVSPSKIHLPLDNGSIWGSLSGTHSDSVEKIKTFMTEGFKKSGLEMTRNLTQKNKSSLIFDNTQSLTDEQQEKRKVNLSFERVNDTTYLRIQYSYGM